ncbi:hypothetical protein ACFY4C_36570 [Actinomadura viridis]|uniref:hypothetical protein n=1 Tax=Actinomadura viridis TaxID=58110 RepID=UPI00368FBBD1
MLDDERTEAAHSPKTLLAYGNRDTTVFQAGRDIYFSEQEILSTKDIPAQDLTTVRDAWVRVDAVDQAVDALRSIGLAVVAGRPGSGRHACALRALVQISAARVNEGHNDLILKNVTPDWEEPNTSLLPSHPSHGYILDVEQSIEQWNSRSERASDLVSFAAKLHSRGSYLVLISNEHGWPLDSGAQTRVHVLITQRPSARDIAIRHLVEIYRKPERAHWLDIPSEVSSQSHNDKDHGCLSYLISDDTSPARAAALAARLSSIEGDEKSRKSVAEEFQAWAAHLKSIFGDGAGDVYARRRSLLITSALLDGAPATRVHQTAREFLGERTNGDDSADVMAILGSPDLKTRFEDIGAEVKNHRVRLDGKRGLARATLRHVWEQQPEIHRLLLRLIKQITKADGAGAEHLEQISRLLVDLAVHENDVSLFEVGAEWAQDPARHDLVTRMIGDAALSDTLGAQTHRLLLEWAKKNNHQATVAARVCGAEFGLRLPRKAMVRLRWVLEVPQRNTPVSTAENAVRKLASHAETLPIVWKVIVGWLSKQEITVGTARAFLAVLDPQLDASALKELLRAGEHDSHIADILSHGWRLAMAQPRVSQEVQEVAKSWIRLFTQDNDLPQYAHDLLDANLHAHLTADPVSALLYGIPGETADAELVAFRRSFALRHFSGTDH